MALHNSGIGVWRHDNSPYGIVVMSPSANLPRCVMRFWTHAHAFSLYDPMRYFEGLVEVSLWFEGPEDVFTKGLEDHSWEKLRETITFLTSWRRSHKIIWETCKRAISKVSNIQMVLESETNPKDVSRTRLEDTLNLCCLGALKTSLQMVLKISLGDNLETGLEDALTVYAFEFLETFPMEEDRYRNVLKTSILNT